MKKVIILFVYILTIQFSVTASDEKSIDFRQLPQQAQQLINKHFSTQSIALIKLDSEFLDKSYEVIFTNGNKIEFDKKGIWKKIKSKYATIPLELIPIQIKNYVSKNYPNIKIIEIEKEKKNRYEIELSNNTDLKFDSQFNLIDIDN